MKTDKGPSKVDDEQKKREMQIEKRVVEDKRARGGEIGNEQKRGVKLSVGNKEKMGEEQERGNKKKRAKTKSAKRLGY